MRWIALALISVACASSQPSHPPGTSTQAFASNVASVGRGDGTSSPRSVAPVTVAIVVDQLAAWVARERLPHLRSSGGFARLRREGAWYQDVRFAHSITDTAPGHASLYTGKVPREHGIVANELWVGDHAVAIVADETSRAVVADGIRSESSSSLRAYSGELVADRFKASVPNARVYSFSLKDRGALPGGGHHPDLSLWYDAKLGQFLSSTALTQKLPDWVLPALGLKARLDQVWMPSATNVLLGVTLETGDGQIGEADYAAYGTKFPHQPSRSTQPYAAFRASPESDKLLLELGLLALDNTPSDVPVLLALSLSANDYIGHLFGPDSWEAKDELVRLDAALGWFFEQLDQRRGPARWNLVLSADHGVVPLPEVSQLEFKTSDESTNPVRRPTEITNRLGAPSVVDAAKKGAKKFGAGRFVTGFADPYLYLTEEAKQLKSDRAAQLQVAIVSGLKTLPCVEAVFDTATMRGPCPAASDESLEALVCRAIQPGKGGDYYIALKPGCFFDTGYVLGYGTSHGGIELADRSIPLLVRAPNKADAGKVVTEPRSFELFSQLLNELLGTK